MKAHLFYPALLLFLILQSCNTQPVEVKVRSQVDTLGFAQYAWQMDSILSRIPAEDKPESIPLYRAVICPHDDYSYAGGLYTKTLAGVRAPIVVLVGVAHKARVFGLEDRLVFGSFKAWKAPGGPVKVSPLRDSLLERLSPELCLVHDSMMAMEHSLEAIVPFLQYYNPDVEIIPVLIPYMRFEQMEIIANAFAKELSALMKRRGLEFGGDLAIVISNDALHYGDEDWGGSDMAPFGCDSAGNARAAEKDRDIIENSLLGTLDEGKAKGFFTYTVSAHDYKSYAWTWCGRYSVPFGLLLSMDLQDELGGRALEGELFGYRSSISTSHIPVGDLGMGVTAPASEHHWVSYVGVGYR